MRVQFGEMECWGFGLEKGDGIGVDRNERGVDFLGAFDFPRNLDCGVKGAESVKGFDCGDEAGGCLWREIGFFDYRAGAGATFFEGEQRDCLGVGEIF